MIECKSCRQKCGYSERVCPNCNTPITPTQDEIKSAKVALDRAYADRDAARIVTFRHFLADYGDTESQREYAKLLEKSSSSEASKIDEAMNYYYSAACKHDPYSAYRYSRLVERTSSVCAKFWLRFAALLGSIESYPDASELFSLEGREDIAAYYCSLAAACDDTNSIVNMAKRWNEGMGVPKNDAFAKWYLDKMTIPPISAIKLAYRLRSVKAEEPERLVFPDYDKYLKSLADEAQKYNFDTAYFYIMYTLYKRGNSAAEVTVATLLAEGRGCDSNPETAYRLLNAAIAHGNPVAALYLGREHLSGKIFKKDARLALDYFSSAADLGYTDAYEDMGDIYEAGEICDIDVARAIELYDMAAAGGSARAREKSQTLKAKREELCRAAEAIMNKQGSVNSSDAEAAFKYLAIATGMGAVRAPRLLAKCYAFGFGTKKDKPSAHFWFKHAADIGDTNAYLPLALCYSKGFGTAFSYKKAVKYFKMASSIGCESAEKELCTLYQRKMTKTVRSLYSAAMGLIYQKKYSEAVATLHSFEEIGYPKALYTLGCLYEFGRGVAKSDKATASAYYEKAFKGSTLFGSFNDPSSAYKLKMLKLLR